MTELIPPALPFLKLENIGKRFGGTVALDGHRLVGKCRRSPLPGGREWIRQIHAHQDRRRRLSARCRRPHRHRRHGLRSPVALSGKEARHPGHLSGPLAVSEPQRLGKYRHRPGTRRAAIDRTPQGYAHHRHGRPGEPRRCTCRSTPSSVELAVAERQIVAICRGLAANARLLFMDEPTSSLTHHEVVRLLEIVRRLKELGIGGRFRQPSAGGSRGACRTRYRTSRRAQGRHVSGRRGRRSPAGRADDRKPHSAHCQGPKPGGRRSGPGSQERRSQRRIHRRLVRLARRRGAWHHRADGVRTN